MYDPSAVLKAYPDAGADSNLLERLKRHTTASSQGK